MSLFDQLTLLSAFLAAGIVLFFIFQPPISPSLQAPPLLTLDGSTSAFHNDPLSLTLLLRNAPGETIVLSGAVDQTLSCAASPCPYTLSLPTHTVGHHLLSVRVGNQLKEWSYTVRAKTTVCIDGTLEGACNASHFLCSTQKLSANCTLCGCADNAVCTEGQCTPLSASFSIPTLTFDTPLYAGGKTTIAALVRNDSSFSVNGTYVLQLEWYSSTNQKLGEAFQQILLSHLSSTQTHTASISSPVPFSAHAALVHLHPISAHYSSATILASSTLHTTSVITDTTPPAPPVSLSATIEDNSLLLSWGASPSTDVAFYRVYEPTLSAGGFTSYRIADETSALFASLALPEMENSSYTVSSVDYAGNESPPAPAIVVSAP